MHFSSSCSCMVKGTPFYVGYLTPILIVITSNFVVLFMVCHSLGKQPNLQKSNHMKMITKVRIIASLSVLMGSTWIFGLFAVGKLTLPFQMIFCALNSLQGFFIFTFYCARNKDVRNEWRHCVARIDQSFRLCCRSSQRKQNESGSDVTMNIYAINRDASPSGTDKCVTDDVL